MIFQVLIKIRWNSIVYAKAINKLFFKRQNKKEENVRLAKKALLINCIKKLVQLRVERLINAPTLLKISKTATERIKEIKAGKGNPWTRFGIGQGRERQDRAEE